MAQLKAIRISDGQEIWKFDCPDPRTRGTTIPTPLAVGKYVINIPDLDPIHAVEWDPTDLAKPARMAWKTNYAMFTPIHQFRHHQSYLYGFSGEIQGASEQAASDSVVSLVCLQLETGKMMWQQPGFKSGVSLTLADGLLLIRSYQTLQLIEANPQEFKLHGAVTTMTSGADVESIDFVQPVLMCELSFARPKS